MSQDGKIRYTIHTHKTLTSVLCGKIGLMMVDRITEFFSKKTTTLASCPGSNNNTMKL